MDLRSGVWARLYLLALLCPLIATAQRVDENPVTAAGDAFGTTVGSQAIGLYDAENVRGFSPRDAGNLRIEGLYFDQQTSVDGCLVSAQSIKVGLAAQSFDFPAPTGIANYSLSVAGPGALTSVVFSRGPFDGAALELDGQYGREAEPVSVTLCFHRYSNADLDFAKRAQNNETGLVVHGQGPGDVEWIIFGGSGDGSEHNLLPMVYTNGVEGVPTFRQMRLPTQDWTRGAWQEVTAGAIVRTTGPGPWALAAGVFRSAATSPASYQELFVDVSPDRTAFRQLDVVPPVAASSTSGEVRLSRRTASAASTQQWALTVRGRAVSRSFGGDAITTDPQRVSIDEAAPVAEPPAHFTAGSVDRVHQYGLGISFDQSWTGRGSVGVGVQKVSYQRFIDGPGAAGATDKSAPVLPTFRFTVIPSPDFLLYGSYTRGLEDSALAPANARNRGESPPATTTWQVDGGVRYTPRPQAQWLLGAFEVDKAYFNLNSAGLYTQLGQVRHRGLEASGTFNGGQGLVAVLGAVWLHAEVRSGEGATAAPAYTPLGTVPLLLNADLDYAPASLRPWSLSGGWTGISSRPATSNGNVLLPAYSQLSFTVRYQFRVFGHSGLARLEAHDIGDSNAMLIDSSGLVVSERGRSFALTVTADL